MAEEQKKILIVDDDKLVNETLQTILTGAGYLTKSAFDGNEASSAIMLEQFDIVLSDIRMPRMSGIELLHFIKKERPTPVILMTGFSEITDAKEAFDIGAAGFLPKPFKKTDLLSVLKEVLGGGEAIKETEEDIDPHFRAIRIDEFTTGHEIRYDIYIRISKKKYIKIASGGENLNHEQINRFKEKGLAHLYLTKNDFRKYLGFNIDLAKKVIGAEQIEMRRKVGFLMQTSMETTKNLFVNEVDRESFETAKEAVVMSLDLMAESPNIFDMLEGLRTHADHLYAHSLAVSIYSTMIAKKIGWTSPRTVAKVSMCGLFHDIGKKEVAKEILVKPRIKRTPEETKVFESHPPRGKEILALSGELPEEIGQVAIQHHENCAGLGYPMHLSKHKIQPIARIVGLANDFCNLIIANPDQETPLTPIAALQKMAQNFSNYDEEFLNGLRQLIVPMAKPK